MTLEAELNWNPEPIRAQWQAHDAKFVPHYEQFLQAWEKLGWRPPQWTNEWVRHVQTTLGFERVQVKCLPVWRIFTLPDINIATVCDPRMVPCGLINAQISYFPAPDSTLNARDDLRFRWKCGVVGDMCRCYIAPPRPWEPRAHEIAVKTITWALTRLGIFDAYNQLTAKGVLGWRCHTFGYLIFPSEKNLPHAQVEAAAPPQSSPADDFRLPIF